MDREKSRYWVQLDRFLYGLPSIVVAAAAVIVVLAASHAGQDALLREYEGVASKALDAGDLKAADVYYRKLAWMDERSATTNYGMALTAEKLGDDARASALMSRVAPADRIGYAPAHFWLAQRIMDAARAERVMDESIGTLEHHLQSTVSQQPKNAQAQLLIGQYYIASAKQTGDAATLEKSLGHLRLAVDSYPEFRMQLAAIYRSLGKSLESGAQARLYRDYQRNRLQTNPNDWGARLKMAGGQSFLHEFKDATETLRAGLDGPRRDEFRRAMATTYLSWANDLDPTQPKLFGKRLELLQSALELQPGNQAVLTHLATLTGVSGNTAEKARIALKEALAEGRAPATVHLILGTISMLQKNAKEAEYHLDQALELDPKMPEVLNNLAWFIAHSDSPDLERALELANAAADMRPASAEIKETRGQILVMLDRNQDALKDMLVAVRAFPNRAGVHETLAAIYHELGDRDMATRHRIRKQELESNNTAGGQRGN